MQDFVLNAYAHLHQNPALWILITLSAYLFGQYLFRMTRFNPFFSPIIVAVITVMTLLLACGIPYEEYFAGAGFIHFLLGPATVVLAVPLYEQRAKLQRLWLPLAAGLCVGCITSIVSVVVLGWIFGLSSQTLISMIPKSVTTPIAMGISQNMGGLPDLTACLVVITGILGSLLSKPVFKICRFSSDAVRGVSLGLTAHGMGTSAAFQISNDAGAFSGLAMGMSGILSAFLAPFIAIPLMRLLGI